MTNPFPHEILSLLFVSCISSASTDKNYAVYRLNRRLVLNIASVCQRWRQIACTTSELWTTCWLVYNHPEINTLWLSRTGSHLFDVIGLPAPPMYECGALEEIIASITPFMQRCRSLSISLSSMTQNSSVEVGKFSAPSLISCQCQPINGWDNIPDWFYQSLYDSSQLQKLDIKEYSPLLKPILANISSLHISYSQEVGVPLQKVLTNSPNLRTLELLMCRILEIMETPTPTVHETLVDLRLHFTGNDVELIFVQITLPSLKVLSLGGEGLDAWPAENTLSFYAFLKRSQCRLDTFISDMEPRPLIYAMSHRSMSTLRTLELSGVAISPQLLAFLIETTNLSTLRELRMRDAYFPGELSLSLLTDMILARRAPIDTGEPNRSTGSSFQYFELGISEYFMGACYQFEPEYELQARRIKAIAEASKGEVDTLVVQLQNWGPGRIVTQTPYKYVSDIWDTYTTWSSD